MTQLSILQRWYPPQLSKSSFETYVHFKKVSENKQHWQEVQELTNWKGAHLLQEYKKPNSKQVTQVHWRLPATGKTGIFCGIWQYQGCMNYTHKKHNGKAFVRKFKTSCKKSSCPECWYSWVSREAFRSTQRFENYENVKEKHGFRRPKLIHVIFSPPWSLKFSRYDEVKKKLREFMAEAGIVGGIAIYHPFGSPKSENPEEWVVRPHFHVLGYGWLKDTNKIERNGWVIKNKGIRKPHSTLSYLLTHCGISDKVHSVFWFGELGYRGKYASEIKVIEDKLEHKLCQFCGFLLHKLEFIGSIDPPPDSEFEALLDPKNWKSVA